MGFTVNFTDNQSVSAAAVNAIAEGLIAEDSEEKVTFEDGRLYGVDDLNGITKSLITKGVSTGCIVSCEGENVLISGGTAFFADGKKITIDLDGITLTRDTGRANYVWLSNDEASGVVSAKCTAEEPSGDYVMLATVSESGIVKKKQDIALMKNASLLPNHYGEAVTVTTTSSAVGGTETREIEAGGDFKRMVVISSEEIAYLDWEKMTGYKSLNLSRVYDLSDTSNPFGITLSYSGDTSVSFISYEGNILTLKIDHGYASRSCTIYFM